MHIGMINLSRTKATPHDDLSYTVSTHGRITWQQYFKATVLLFTVVVFKTVKPPMSDCSKCQAYMSVVAYKSLDHIGLKLCLISILGNSRDLQMCSNWHEYNQRLHVLNVFSCEKSILTTYPVLPTEKFMSLLLSRDAIML